MPAISTTDLNNAKTDVDHIAAIANSTDMTATDRLGRTKRTLAGLSAEFPNAAANATASAVSAFSAEAAKNAAEAAQVLAQSASTASAVALAAQDTIALGRASVVDSQTFWVKPNMTDGLARYTNYLRTSSTTQTYVADLVLGTELDQRVGPLQAALYLQTIDGSLSIMDRMTGQVAGEVSSDGTLLFRRMASGAADGSIGASQSGASGGMWTLADAQGRIAVEVDEAGVTHIAKLALTTPLEVTEMPTEKYGGYRGTTVEQLAEHVGLAGNFGRYGNAMRNPIGADLRRLGAVVTPLAGTYRSGMVESPCVWQDTDQLYHMVFTAYSGTAAAPLVGSVGHAVSKDLVNWTVDASPIFEGSGVDGSPDKVGCTGPVMCKGDDGIYYLYYIGLPLSGYEAGTKTICLATASSLAGPWTRLGIVVGTGAAAWRSSDVYHIDIKRRHSTYYMFFNAKGTGSGSNSQGNERIGFATSVSLAGPWVVDDANSPIINTVNDTWESQKVGDPSVWFDEGTGEWRMAYFGYNGTDASDGYAWTTDEEFPFNWRKRADNPVLAKQLNSTWERGFAHKPFVFKVGATLHHYYTGTGTGTGSKRGICMAVSGAGVACQWVGDQDGYTRYVEASPYGNALDLYKRDDGVGAWFGAGYNGITQSFQVGRVAGNGLTESVGFSFDGDNVAIGSSATLAVNATKGFLWVPSIAGPPTGVPTADSAVKGERIALCIDQLNNRLYHYNGGWKYVNLT